MPSTPTLPTRPVNTISSHTGPINTIAFSNLGGTYILTGSSDRQIHLSKTEPSSFSSSTSTQPNKKTTSEPIQRYTSHGYPVLSLTVSSQNTHFASTGGDRSVFYWDIQEPKTTIRRFGNNTNQSHTARITCVSFAGENDDSVLVSGSDDRTVRLWDVKSRDTRPLQVLDEAKDSVSALVVSSNTYEIVAGSVDGRVRSYDVRMGKVTVDVQPGAVTSLDLSKSDGGRGGTLLVGCLDGRIRLMDRRDGSCLRTFPPAVDGKMGKGEDGGYKNEAFRLQSCLGADDGLVLSGSEADGNVKAWDVLTGKMVHDFRISEVGKVVSVIKWRDGSVAQDRKSVWAAGGADGIVRVYGN